MTIEICNHKTVKPRQSWDIIIDRRSIFGNPFHINSYTNREQSIRKYKTYFYRRLQTDAAFKASLNALKEIHKRAGLLRLFCWCAPLACHGDVIKEYLESDNVE